jgi:opacity protein-like surface antigen
MFGRKWKSRLYAAAVAAALVVSPAVAVVSEAAQGRNAPRRHEEPAYARGYADGYQRGLTDGRNRDRYDPVGSREYRDGDQGYYDGYGSRDAYRTNYRAGFRQGYEDGYRDGTR